MIPSLPINEHDQTHSGWFAARRSQARIHNLNSPISALANTPYIPQRTHSHQPAHPASPAKMVPDPSRPHLVSNAGVLKSP
jgi:hypothetical protein